MERENGRQNMSQNMSQVDTVVFDLGGVLVDWSPRYVYGELIDDPAELDDFLANVCNEAWIVEQDRGRSLTDGVAELAARHPDKAELIEAFLTRWPDMLRGPIGETVEILSHLRGGAASLYALSNWPAETWPHALERFHFLRWFEGVVVSGFEGSAKPEARIYRVLLERYGLDPRRTVFIDDRQQNIDGAERAGMLGVLYTDPAALRSSLKALGLV